MKTCPSCESTSAWILADGRCKCRNCGMRYSWKSVWDSVRLPEQTKRLLLAAFVEGIPVYRQRFDDGACVDSRERFYRLMRACCALHARVSEASTYIAACHPTMLHGARSRMRGWAATRRVMIIGISEVAGAVEISTPPRSSLIDVIPILPGRTAVGGVYCVHGRHAFANLQVQGDYVVVPRSARAPLAMSSIEIFWDYARERLQKFRKIPCKFFHLYLGEMCFRFNHRDRDVAQLLHELLRSTSATDVKLVLGASTERADATEQSAVLERDTSADLRVLAAEA